jgi:hypothetical protein
VPSLAARVIPAEDVAHREVAGETVAVNLRTGQYHSLNPVAGRMLDELLEGPTVGAALERLDASYDVPREELERDLLELCDALAARGLVGFADDA